MENETHDFKVVLVGKGCVGKTSIILRYNEDKFSNNWTSTVQASFVKKKLNLDGKRVNLCIWDTAGQDKFHALGPLYYRSSNGALVVYDITDHDSFEKTKLWVKELRKILGTDFCLVVVGNKTDLEKDRQVAVEEAEEYASKVDAVHWHTSAKNNEGIEEMFFDLIHKMLERKAEQNHLNNSVSRQGSQRRNVIVVDDEDEQPASRNCCSSS